MYNYLSFFLYFSKITHYYIYIYNNITHNFFNFSKLELSNLTRLIQIFCKDANFFLLNNNFTSVNALGGIDNTKTVKFKKSISGNSYIEFLSYKDIKIDNLKSKSWNCKTVFEYITDYNSLSFCYTNSINNQSNFLVFNKKFNFFLLLIGSGWHHSIGKNKIRSSVIQLSTSNTSKLGMRQYSMLSVAYLWKFWSNTFMMIFNISFYNINFFTFSRIYFKKIVDFSNWMLWPYSYFFWKFFNKFFFYKFIQISLNTKKFLKFFNSFINGIVFITDTNYHKFLISYSKKYNIVNVALVDYTAEPWCSPYPIFCRTSINMQYLFLNVFFKIRIMGLNLFFFFKKNFLFLIRISTFLKILQQKI